MEGRLSLDSERGRKEKGQVAPPLGFQRGPLGLALRSLALLLLLPLALAVLSGEASLLFEVSFSLSGLLLILSQGFQISLILLFDDAAIDNGLLPGDVGQGGLPKASHMAPINTFPLSLRLK